MVNVKQIFVFSWRRFAPAVKQYAPSVHQREVILILNTKLLGGSVWLFFCIVYIKIAMSR